MDKLSASNVSRAVGRVSGRMLRRNRLVSAGIEASKVTAVAAGRAARRLWLEVTGFLFGVFAVVGAVTSAREYLAGGPISRIAVGALFTLIFAYFSLSSFLLSRRTPR